MIRDMKFHIYNPDHEPLCWEDKALEFDTLAAANAFLRSVGDEDLLEDAVIAENILYYDGGYLNATYLRVSEDGEELIAISTLANQEATND